MANQDLGTATKVATALKKDCVYIEVNGSVRRIALDDLMNVINNGDDMLLRQVAWGFPVKQNQSSTAWGMLGNAGLKAEYESRIGRYLTAPSGLSAKLSPTNSGVFADGTAIDESKGNVMVIAPRLYYVVKPDAESGLDYVWMSYLPIGGHWIGNCNGGEYICLGAYLGSMVGSTLVSRSGLTPTGSKTIEAFWTAAQVNGPDWGLTNYDLRRWMELIAIAHYGNSNIQAMLGYGVGGDTGVDVWNAAGQLKTGATKSLGDALGKINIGTITNTTDSTKKTTNSSRVSLFGIEDPYGWFWEMLQGIYCGNSANASQTGTEVFIYEGNRLPTAAELSTHPNGSYRQISRRVSATDGSGYIKNMIVGEYFDLFATTVGGGSTSYWADYDYVNNTGQLVLWGGSANFGPIAGLACSHSRDAFSNSNASYAARLAFYGTLTFTTGKRFMASV